jgi:hypothetical protein
MSEENDNAPAEEKKEKKTYDIKITCIESQYEKMKRMVIAGRPAKDKKKPVTDEDVSDIASKAFKKGLAKADVKSVPTVTWD